MLKVVRNLLAGVGAATVVIFAAETAPALPEVLRLKDQVQTLKEQLAAQQIETERCHAERADWRARAQSAGLTEVGAQLRVARKALDDEMVKALGGDPDQGDALDRTTDPPTLTKAPPKDENKK